MLDLFNPKQPATPGPAAPSTPAPVKPLVWLARALGIQTQIVPTLVDTGPVASTVDVLQGGWALAQYVNFSQEVAQSGPAPARAYVLIGGEVNPPAPTIAFAGLVLVALTFAWTSLVAPQPSTGCGISLVTQFPPVTLDPADPFVVADLASTMLPAGVLAPTQPESASWGAITGNPQAVLFAPPGFALAAWVELGGAITGEVIVKGVYSPQGVRTRA